jgi:pyruvate/2-oxoglutarate dehydrogenase complex dihydrolipoamide dehydrogenase (E3) component
MQTLAVGAVTHTQCVNPEKMRLQLKENKGWKTDTGERPRRVFVVGDIPGRAALTVCS